jgi:hypothetical protein
LNTEELFETAVAPDILVATFSDGFRIEASANMPRNLISDSVREQLSWRLVDEPQ